MTVQALATHHHELFHERARAAVLVATAATDRAAPPAAVGPTWCAAPGWSASSSTRWRAG